MIASVWVRFQPLHESLEPLDLAASVIRWIADEEPVVSETMTLLANDLCRTLRGDTRLISVERLHMARNWLRSAQKIKLHPIEAPCPISANDLDHLIAQFDGLIDWLDEKDVRSSCSWDWRYRGTWPKETQPPPTGKPFGKSALHRLEAILEGRVPRKVGTVGLSIYERVTALAEAADKVHQVDEFLHGLDIPTVNAHGVRLTLLGRVAAAVHKPRPQKTGKNHASSRSWRSKHLFGRLEELGLQPLDLAITLGTLTYHYFVENSLWMGLQPEDPKSRELGKNYDDLPVESRVGWEIVARSLVVTYGRKEISHWWCDFCNEAWCQTTNTQPEECPMCGRELPDQAPGASS